MARKQQFTVSDLYCTKCGKKGIPVARKRAQQRETGHLKKMHCIFCQIQTNHIEIRPFDYDYTVENLQEDIKNGVYEGRQYEE